MIKIIISIITILTFSICNGQYDWRAGKVVLKNGQTLKGIVKMTMPSNKLVSLSSSKVYYKKNRKGKVKKFTKDEIRKVFYGSYNSETGFFEYAPITKNKKELFRVIINGKSKLYKRTVKNISYSNRILDPSISPRRPRKKDIQFVNQYYVIRNGEITVTYIPDESLEKFKEKTISYFSDCKKIIQYIENNLYEEFEIKELVEDYNIFCE
ncbi:hypothetical protein [uncultured Aquimarina sp.]|uniref:hypothetical protein n=1 Tax=uncultured Aquimarina sp. TaxID=575652 RepID=UPI0026107B75|nr:hypothetical protein [uncultured Aquimarina sp.]